MLLAKNLDAFCDQYIEFLTSLDKMSFDVALRMAVRCFLHNIGVRNKEIGSALKHVIVFRSDDTSLAEPPHAIVYPLIAVFSTANSYQVKYRVWIGLYIQNINAFVRFKWRNLTLRKQIIW